jgi:hypothetical protein
MRKGVQPSPWRVLAMLLLGMLFVLAIMKSTVVTVAWWQGRLQDAGIGEWFWIGILPVLVFIYLRYFSVLACPPGQCPVDPPRAR